MPSNREVCIGSEKPFRSLLMVANTVKWPINPEPFCDKQGVRHVGGQLGETDRGRERGGDVQIGLRHTNRRKSHSDVSVRTVLWLSLGRLYERTADRLTGGQKDRGTDCQMGRGKEVKTLQRVIQIPQIKQKAKKKWKKE